MLQNPNFHIVIHFKMFKFSSALGWVLGNLSAHFWIVPLFLVVFSVSPTQGTELGNGNYRIENGADNLDLTIQGVNASFATVVADTWQNFKEQKWAMKKIPFTAGYQLQPATYAVNNVLSFHKDPLRKYPQPETWMFKEVKVGNTGGKRGQSSSGLFQLINERTTYCLTSTGRRRQVVELKCDIYQRTQHWKIIKV